MSVSNNMGQQTVSVLIGWIILVSTVRWMARSLDVGSCHSPLGMESGDIKDDQLSASSSFDLASVGPQYARARVDHMGGAWCPKHQIQPDVKEYLEVDLGKLMALTGVETQGRFGNGHGQEYAEYYLLEYWRPRMARWVRFRNRTGHEVFHGNSNTYFGVERPISPPILASKLRFVPYSVHPRTVCMRVEIYGCPWNDELLSYSMPQGERRGTEIDLYDMTYDGVEEENFLYGGLGQLTDGQIGLDNFRLDASGFGKGYEWVGWKNDSAASSQPVAITFEFNNVRKFHAMYVHTNNMHSKDVQVFSSAKIFFSVGGRYFNGDPVQFSYMPDLVMENARNVTIKLYGKVGRFAQVLFHFGARWMMISEVSFDSEPAEGHYPEETEQMPHTTTPAHRPQEYDQVSAAVSEDSLSGKRSILIGILSGAILVLLLVILIIVIRLRMKKNSSHVMLRPTEKPVNINMKTINLIHSSRRGSPLLPESSTPTNSSTTSSTSSSQHNARSGSLTQSGHPTNSIPLRTFLPPSLFFSPPPPPPLPFPDGSSVFAQVAPEDSDSVKTGSSVYQEPYKPHTPPVVSPRCRYANANNNVRENCGASPVHDCKSVVVRKLPDIPSSPDYTDKTGSYTSREYAEPDLESAALPTVALMSGTVHSLNPHSPVLSVASGQRSAVGQYTALDLDSISQSSHRKLLNGYLTDATSPASSIQPSSESLCEDQKLHNSLRCNFQHKDDVRLQGVSGNTVYAIPDVDVLGVEDVAIYEFPRRHLRFIEKLGEGQFGEVHLCHLEHMEKSVNAPSKLVAVKMLRPDAGTLARADFYKEVKVLSKLCDPNIVRVLGVCTTDDPLCLIVEYAENGDLNQFLRQHSLPLTTARHREAKILSYGGLIYVATQISSGMKYIESLNFVHRDLATRNCLVGNALTIKIADFGMSRDLYSSDYYRIDGRAVLPIRWMAWESLLLGKFTTKSDVWSFAVTLWEILLFARQQPYNDMSDDAVIENVGHFYHNDGLQAYLTKPPNCPKEIYDLMRECWQRNEVDRPTFKEIHLFLQRKNLGYQPDR